MVDTFDVMSFVKVRNKVVRWKMRFGCCLLEAIQVVGGARVVAGCRRPLLAVLPP